MASRTNYVQYSKRLASWITVIWAVMRLGAMIASIIRPEIADAMVALLSGLDGIMMANIGFYSGNSAAEKISVGFFNAQAKKQTSDEEEEVG